jgi:hypothetical protein
LLLCCASPGDPAQKIERLGRLIDEGIDWDLLIESAVENRIIPQLYLGLNALDASRVPESARQSIADLYQESTLHNLTILQETVSLLRMLAAEGIEAIPYKGPLLASMLYGNLAHRQMWDLDLLVHAEDVPAARQCLAAHGYRPERPLDRNEEARLIARDCEIHYTSANDLHIEVHWRILPAGFVPAFNDSWIWDNLVTRTLHHYTLRTLRPEALFVVLSLHSGYKHSWARMRWICDIAQFLRMYPDVDWEWIRREADRLDVARFLCLGLHLAQCLLGASLPPAPRRWVESDRSVPGLGGMTRGRLFRKDRGLPGFEEWIAYLREHAAGGASGPPWSVGWAERLRYLGLVMTPGSDDNDIVAALPIRMKFLHYVVRPVRLFLTHGPGLLKRVH